MDGKRKKKLIYKLAAIVLLMALSFYSCSTHHYSTKLSYRVIKIYDGDTLLVTDGNIDIKIRLAGIDAPEKATYWGRRAKIYLEELLLNKNVSIQQLAVGKYNRLIATVFLEQDNINHKITRDGFAEYYRIGCIDYEKQNKKGAYKYDIKPYIQLEKEAKNKKLNIWSAKDYISPCKYRKMSQ